MMTYTFTLIVLLEMVGTDWVEYLEFFILHNYKTCLEKLDEYDVVGTEYLGPPNHRNPHMSGNFWWTKSSHIKNLVVPLEKAPRHQFEWFILKTKNKTTIWNFHNSKSTKGFPGFNTKRRRYERHEYNNINQGKVIKINFL